MNDQLRIGDAERESAARELGEHFALGRITADEHAERLEQVWAARTAADLRPAFRDLPRPRPAEQASGAAGSSVRRVRAWRPELPRFPFPLKLLIAIVLVWWGLHHPLFLVLAVVVYVVLVRRFFRRSRRWGGRPGSWSGGYRAGWR